MKMYYSLNVYKMQFFDLKDVSIFNNRIVFYSISIKKVN